jgi:hypothetical protein
MDVVDREPVILGQIQARDGDGTGGSVCTRTLQYDNGWTVVAA